MLKLSFITIHAEFIQSYFKFGAFKAARNAGSLSLEVVNLRDYSSDERGSVDGRVYGGGDGMILSPEPLARATKALRNKDSKVVLLSPQGNPWSQPRVESAAKLAHLILVCGRFGGVDQRYIDHYVDEEISIGNFVISGGELAALTVADSLVRQLPGALGHKESAVMDSFASGLEGRLEHPQYTRPEVFEGEAVPEVLLSGHHKKIAAWQEAASIKITNVKRQK